MAIQSTERIPNLDHAASLSGMLGIFSLIDLIQMVANAGKSGQLTISADDCYAQLHFNDGMLVDAETDGLSGDDAFYRIVQIQEGHFEFRSQSPWRKMTICANLTQLLLEALRRIDEKQRDSSMQWKCRNLAARAG